MKKSLVKRTLLALSLLAALPAMAQLAPEGRGRQGRPAPGAGQPPVERMLERLDLTEDQQVEIDSLLARARESAKVKLDQLRAGRERMQQLLEAEELDETAYRTAARAAAELEADLTIDRSRTMREVRAKLTPEQLAQADEMIEHRRDARQGARRDRGGPRPGARPAPRPGAGALDPER